VARKKSIKLATTDFNAEVDKIINFLNTVSTGQSDEHISWLHNYSIIRLYKEFEGLMLDALVAAVNNDTSTLEATTDVKFPKHLTDEVCEFLITGTGYFDFKGRPGLIKTLKSFIPEKIT
jgi:cupin superfamily acireductone dioxygenase involved in methionine salvage